VADLVDLANEKVGDRHMGIGPSYFMGSGDELDEGRVRRIWKRAVIPYIEEQFFGNEDRLAEFDFDRLLSELNYSVNGNYAEDVPHEDKQAEEKAIAGSDEEPPVTEEQEGVPAADANSTAA
jgi:hypothetical protein